MTMAITECRTCRAVITTGGTYDSENACHMWNGTTGIVCACCERTISVDPFQRRSTRSSAFRCKECTEGPSIRSFWRRNELKAAGIAATNETRRQERLNIVLSAMGPLTPSLTQPPPKRNRTAWRKRRASKKQKLARRKRCDEEQGKDEEKR